MIGWSRHLLASITLKIGDWSTFLRNYVRDAKHMENQSLTHEPIHLTLKRGKGRFIGDFLLAAKGYGFTRIPAGADKLNRELAIASFRCMQPRAARQTTRMKKLKEHILIIFKLHTINQSSDLKGFPGPDI